MQVEVGLGNGADVTAAWMELGGGGNYSNLGQGYFLNHRAC